MERADLWKKLYIAGITANIIALLVVLLHTRGEVAEISWTSYTSDKYGYSLSYPQHWKESEIKVQDVYEEARFSESEDVYFTATNSVAAAMQANLFKNKKLTQPLIDVCHKAALKDLPARFTGFKELKTMPATVGMSSEARETTFQFTQRKGFQVRAMSGRIMTVWNSSRPVELMLVCTKRDYRRIEPLFAKYLESYKTGKPLGETAVPLE